MLKHGEANPLNVFGLRILAHCPPHFERVQFELYTNEKDICDWIHENLEGRFYIGPTDIKSKSSTVRQTLVAFELHQEASYFSLFLPQINQNPWDSF